MCAVPPRFTRQRHKGHEQPWDHHPLWWQTMAQSRNFLFTHVGFSSPQHHGHSTRKGANFNTLTLGFACPWLVHSENGPFAYIFKGPWSLKHEQDSGRARAAARRLDARRKPSTRINNNLEACHGLPNKSNICFFSNPVLRQSPGTIMATSNSFYNGFIQHFYII